ncbi:hypothetical protein BGZ57DRAFT_935136 [Hyaloscypha finlandica]|nr:hypothetical protein BGZ57DRAFT_935136 [Hyaloscypha finlandica]
MRFSSLATALLLPLLAIAETTSTTTITSTATLTKTITVSRVYSVTSTYASNSTTATTTTTGPTLLSASASAPTKSIPANYMGAASSLNGMYAGGASVLVMIAAALL